MPFLSLSLSRYLNNFTLGIISTGHWNYSDGGIYLADTGKFLAKGLMTVSVSQHTFVLCGGILLLFEWRVVILCKMYVTN